MEEDLEEETTQRALPAPPSVKPELKQTAVQSPPPPAASIIAQHVIPNRTPPTSTPQTPHLHPTVIAHASVPHPSVIQTLNHIIHGGGPKHVAHLAPSTAPTGSVQLASAHHPISHITVHPVAHLGPHIPALYPQPVAVTQPAVVGHITHTLSHAHMNGTSPAQAAIVAKQGAVMAHHPQLVGQAVLNPVTMVTMPSFPIGTLKLA